MLVVSIEMKTLCVHLCMHMCKSFPCWELHITLWSTDLATLEYLTSLHRESCTCCKAVLCAGECCACVVADCTWVSDLIKLLMDVVLKRTLLTYVSNRLQEHTMLWHWEAETWISLSGLAACTSLDRKSIGKGRVRIFEAVRITNWLNHFVKY